MDIIYKYTLYFIIYSFLGWLMEVICKSIESKRYINRGFLIGPICPIYGYGVLLIILLIGKNTEDILSVFLKAIFICSTLEYLTSYLMEKLFKARWWDYSRYKFNINGRICLETMIPFGILGCSVIYLLHPVIVNFVGLFSSKTIMIMAILLNIVYLADIIVSFNVMNKIKNQIKNQKTDNTETIRKKVLKWLDNNSVLYKHIKDAFPTFKISNVIDKIKRK